MPLPIPNILENAANVLVSAQAVSDTLKASGNPVAGSSELEEALKKIAPSDLLAVLNEVGKVYTALHNIQVLRVGAASEPSKGVMNFLIEIDFGLGARQLIVPMPSDMAAKFSADMSVEAAKLKKGGLITDANVLNG